MQEVIRAWERIEALIPASVLRPGASEAEIQVAEAALGIDLPAQVRVSYLRHDGSHGEFVRNFLLYSLDQMVPAYRKLVDEGADFAECECEEAVPESCTCEVPEDAEALPFFSWYPGWIPLCREGDGSVVGVDTTPDLRGGTVRSSTPTRAVSTA